MTRDDFMNPIAQAVLDLQPDETGAAVEAALDAGARPVEIIDQGIARGTERIASCESRSNQIGESTNRVTQSYTEKTQRYTEG